MTITGSARRARGSSRTRRCPEPITIEARNSIVGTPDVAQDPADLLARGQVRREVAVAEAAEVDDPAHPRGARRRAERGAPRRSALVGDGRPSPSSGPGSRPCRRRRAPRASVAGRRTSPRTTSVRPARRVPRGPPAGAPGSARGRRAPRGLEEPAADVAGGTRQQDQPVHAPRLALPSTQPGSAADVGVLLFGCHLSVGRTNSGQMLSRSGRCRPTVLGARPRTPTPGSQRRIRRITPRWGHKKTPPFAGLSGSSSGRTRTCNPPVNSSAPAHAGVGHRILDRQPDPASRLGSERHPVRCVSVR